MRMIKAAAKRAIYAVLKEADVDDEKLQTVFTATESLLNSKHLTADRGDSNDALVLTTNHFLIEKMIGEIGPDTVDTKAVNVPKRWRREQEF